MFNTFEYMASCNVGLDRCYHCSEVRTSRNSRFTRLWEFRWWYVWVRFKLLTLCKLWLHIEDNIFTIQRKFPTLISLKRLSGSFSTNLPVEISSRSATNRYDSGSAIENFRDKNMIGEGRFGPLCKVTTPEH